MKLHAQKIIGALAILIAAALAPSAKADLVQTVDVNPDPNIFECFITAIERDVTIDGSTVHALVYKDESGAVPPASAGIPVLVMNLKVGEKVICHFVNQLSTESAGIHWHGLELDNDSDGTPVSQDAVLPGQSYTYQFNTFRPGIFWFHPHMERASLFRDEWRRVAQANQEYRRLRLDQALFVTPTTLQWSGRFR